MEKGIRIIIIIVTVTLALIAGVTLFMYLRSGSTTAPASAPTTTGYTNTSDTTNVAPSDGTSLQTTDTISVGGIQVKDFKADPNTVADKNNTGYYYLDGYQTAKNPRVPYTIFYVDSDQSFTVSLMQEPIADTRKAAEQALLTKLGITQSQACALNYRVYVPYAVNQIYSSKNLGFSFCPGAVQL